MMQRRQLGTILGGALLSAMIPFSGNASQISGLRGYLRTNWSRDPLSYGSYSYVAKGSRQRDRRILAEPIDGRIYFAGEATHPEYNSTVHAAYESGRYAADAVLEDGHQRIAIIGAGMSGLAAAHALAWEGKEVHVFEARDRTGGRIWTSKELGDLPLDLGASWIHGTDENPLTQLANKVDLKRATTDSETIIRGADGRRISELNAPLWLLNTVETQNSAGADPNQLNELAYLFSSDYDGDEVIFPDGYSAIFNALTGEYDLHLSSRISDVTLGRGHVELGISASGRASNLREPFDAVIVTLPLGVLKQNAVSFDPPLPQSKQEAIRKLGMGTLDKLYLLFDEAFWDEEPTWILTPENDLPRGQFNAWMNLKPYIGAPVLLAFNGGSPALELAKLQDSQLVDMATKTLAAAYPEASR